MKITTNTKTLPNIGVIEGKLPEDTVDSLWKLIEEFKKNNQKT